MTLLSDKEILEGTLAEFANLAKIPRMSGHEEAVSNFLKERAENLGCTVYQDDRFNLIIDKPATPGYEDRPVVGMQAHMDMVCVAAEGVAYDPLKDPIKLINDGTFLRAEGTSLGADDGIGVAGIMFILSQKFNHGPLRAIFTVDEEQGMSGASKLDPKHLEPIRYLINCDSEAYDTLTVSSAGGVTIAAKRNVTWHEPKFNHTYEFIIRDLCGGHSGEAINRGFANAIKIAGQALYQLTKQGPIELASISSLKAHNVIPSEARFVFTSPQADIKAFQTIVAKLQHFLATAYAHVETDAKVLVEPYIRPARVMSDEDLQSVMDYINLAMTGVLKMSQAEPGLVELSANIGPIRTLDAGIEIQSFPRSNVDSLTEEIGCVYEQLGRRCGLEVSLSEPNPGWPSNPDSKLRDVALEVFNQQNGFEMKTQSIHAGLETSYFYAKNPALDIISIGPNNIDIHSPKERLELRTVAPHVKLVWGIVAKLAE